MKKIIYLSVALSMLITTTVIISSCMKEEDYMSEEVQRLSTNEARNFFERYVAEHEISLNQPGMAPGNFAPQWDKAVVHTLNKRAYADVPIAAEHTYTAYFAKEKAGYYQTAVAQRLVVGKNTETGEMDCAIATIIPDEKSAALSHERVQKMFVHNKNSANFSGVIVYSTIATNSTIAATKYANGKVVAHESVFNYSKTDEQNLTAMAALVRQVVVAGKHTVRVKMWTIELPDIEISGSGGGGGIGGIGAGSVTGGDNGSGNSNLGNNDDTRNGGELPEVVVPGYSGGGGGGGGGGGVWTPPTTPPANPPNITPASKIFNNKNNMSASDWAKVEDMIRKIMNDCAGGKLYSMLVGRSINLVYNPNLVSSGEYAYNDNSIVIKKLSSYDDVLFHEMVHAYQHLMTPAGQTGRSMNREVEATVLQYIYASKQLGYDNNERLQRKFEGNNKLSDNIQWMLKEIDDRGVLTTNSQDIMYMYYYSNIAGSLRQRPIYQNLLYDGNYDSLPNFQAILSDC